MFHGVILDAFLLAADEILEEVDGHRLVVGQVRVAVHHEEVVHLPLGTLHGGELLRRDVHQLNWLADLHVLLAFHGLKIFLDYNAII